MPHFVLKPFTLFIYNVQKFHPFRVRITNLFTQKTFCRNPCKTQCFQTISRLVVMQTRSRWADISKIIFCFFVACLVLQNNSNGSSLSEYFDGPTPVTTVASCPGLRVLQQSIDGIDTHTGAGCETITLQTDRTTLSRILFPVPESMVIDEFSAQVWVRCDHPSARLACKILLPASQSNDQRPVQVFVSGPS
mgnify:FL=1